MWQVLAGPPMRVRLLVEWQNWQGAICSVAASFANLLEHAAQMDDGWPLMIPEWGVAQLTHDAA